MKILICGIGAIGSNVTSLLVPDLKGDHEITVLDMDTVEERNVQAGTQFYMPDQIGMSKVEALQYNIYKWFEREVEIIEGPIEKMTTELILSRYDLAIDCFDNENARGHIQEWWLALKHSGPNRLPCPELLHIGFSDQFTFAIEWAENYKVPSDIMSGFDICEAEGAASFIKMVAALGSQTIQNYIKTGQKKEFIGNRFNVTNIQ